MKQKVEDGESTIMHYNNENERLTLQNITKMKDIEGLKKEMTMIEFRATAETESLRGKIHSFEDNEMDIHQLQIQMDTMRSNHSSQQRQLTEINETTKKEVQRLHELLGFRKKEKEESNKDNQKIKEQVQASFEVNAELEANLDSLNEKYELLKSENSDLS